jgi:hypothetical protein
MAPCERPMSTVSTHEVTQCLKTSHVMVMDSASASHMTMHATISIEIRPWAMIAPSEV